jgi:5-methyltetrahydrofolate--homocysteine methyltransferase
VHEAFDELGTELPLMISATFPDVSGRVLSGQNPEAFWNAVAHANPLIVGSNCGRRFKEMRPFLEELSGVADCYFSAHLNAGLPNAFGEFDETPEIMQEDFRGLRRRGFLNLAGGCCGTTPDHIRAIAAAVGRGSAPLPDPAPGSLPPEWARSPSTSPRTACSSTWASAATSPARPNSSA